MEAPGFDLLDHTNQTESTAWVWGGSSSVVELGLELDSQNYNKQNSTLELSIKPSLNNFTQF